MASSTRTPSRLPARVYWFRRALVLGTAFAVIFAISRMIGGGGADDPSAAAKVTAGKPTPTAVVQRPIGPLPANASSTAAGGGAPVVEVAPDGPCDLSDITVAPVAGTAPAGRTVPLTLQLSGIRPACTFAVSPMTVVAKVTTSKGKVWSTQDCPSSVPKTSVVVRSAAPTTIQISWSGRGSDTTCSRATDWALPGTYQVTSAAIGSEPSEAAMKLTTPPRPVVIKTIKPKAPKSTGKPSKTGTPKTPDTGRRSKTD